MHSIFTFQRENHQLGLRSILSLPSTLPWSWKGHWAGGRWGCWWVVSPFPLRTQSLSERWGSVQKKLALVVSLSQCLTGRYKNCFHLIVVLKNYFCSAQHHTFIFPFKLVMSLYLYNLFKICLQGIWLVVLFVGIYYFFMDTWSLTIEFVIPLQSI